MFNSVLCTGSAFLPLSLTALNGKECSSIPSVIVFGGDDVFKNPLESNVVYQPIASNNMGYDCIVGNFLIQITVGKNHKALQMKLDQFTEPCSWWMESCVSYYGLQQQDSNTSHTYMAYNIFPRPEMSTLGM